MRIPFFGRNGDNPRDPKNDPSSIGRILLAQGLLSQEQLDHALELQKDESLLGKILVREGVITEAQLNVALIKQAAMRAGKSGDHGAVMKVVKQVRVQQQRISRSFGELAVMAENATKMGELE